jgi:DNA polymerase-3 subunit delta
MTEFSYKNYKNYLKKLRKDQVSPVYLIYGEEFLYRKVLETLLDFILTASEKNLNYESVDGANENIEEIVERINT